MTVRKAIERERAGDGVNGRNEGWKEGRRQMMPCERRRERERNKKEGGRERGRKRAASLTSAVTLRYASLTKLNHRYQRVLYN